MARVSELKLIIKAKEDTINELQRRSKLQADDNRVKVICKSIELLDRIDILKSKFIQKSMNTKSLTDIEEDLIHRISLLQKGNESECQDCGLDDNSLDTNLGETVLPSKRGFMSKRLDGYTIEYV